MFGFFYHSTLKNYTIAMGTLFNDIYVERRNNGGQRQQTLKVPISYGPAEKFLVRSTDDDELDRKVAATLPRLSFERIGMFYDGTRKLSKAVENTMILTTDNGTVKTQYAPVPYNFNYSLYGMVSNAVDGDMIAEQIVPYFTPDWTISMRLVPEMSLTMDIPIILESVTNEDTYEGSFEDRRAMIWTFNFLIKGWLFGPVRRGGVIKRTQIDFHTPANIQDLDNAARVQRYELTPGQLANGAPTTNASATIPYSSISANSDWDYVEQTSYFDDGLFYSTESGEDYAKDT